MALLVDNFHNAATGLSRGVFTDLVLRTRNGAVNLGEIVEQGGLGGLPQSAVQNLIDSSIQNNVNSLQGISQATVEDLIENALEPILDDIDALENTSLSPTAVQSLESRDATAPTETTSKYPTSWAKIFENSVERSRRITRFCTKVNRNTFQKSSAALTDPAATKSSSARRSFPGSRSMHAPTQRDTKCGAASENGRRTTRESNPRPNHW